MLLPQDPEQIYGRPSRQPSPIAPESCGTILRMGIIEIENAIMNLPPEKTNELMAWFVTYHAELRDKKVESLENDRLDSVLEGVGAANNSNQ